MIRNQRGDILVIAIIYAAVSTLSIGIMLAYLQQVSNRGKVPRIKSQMSATEAKLRATLMNPTTYSGCFATNVAGGRSSCSLKTAVINGLGGVIPGTKCPPALVTRGCGIAVVVDNFQALTAANDTQVDVSIKYEGIDHHLADIKVTMKIPADILQAKGIYRCPDSAPIFIGMKPNGQLNCRTLPTPAGPNQFANIIDLSTMTISVSDLPKLRQCPPNEVMTSIKWSNGGNNLDTTCGPRPNAFTSYGFAPDTLASGNGDVVYTPNPAYP